MLEFVKRRCHTENIAPQTEEIQILEVFKKLSESGWTVDLTELKQIIRFVGVDPHALNTNFQLQDYLKAFCRALSLPAHITPQDLVD